MNEPKIVTREERMARQKILGAGDAFAIIAQPIAKAVDAVVGTDIANCAPCKKRRAAWNAAIPFVKQSEIKPNTSETQ